MIVRFDLERDLVVTVEGDHPRIVPEGREYPRPVHRVGGGHDVRLQETLDLQHFHALATVPDRRFERPMRAMLRPGLSDRLQLDVSRVSTQRIEVSADRL